MSFLALGATLVGGAALAQDKPDGDVLRGPAVAPSAARGTLVERDFAGHVRRLEVTPEEAALDLLELDPRARAAADRVLRERWAILDRIVMKNVRLLLDFRTAKAADDKDGMAAALKEFFQELAPLRERGTLGEELAGVLPADKAARLGALAAEYRRALVDEDMSGMNSDKPEAAGPAREVLAEVGQEVKRSYERQAKARQQELDAALSELDLTPEQDARVRKLILDYAQKTLLNPTAGQKRELFRQIAGELTKEQVRRLTEEFRPDRGAKAG